jgi:SAM-dependent methyltransferase
MPAIPEPQRDDYQWTPRRARWFSRAVEVSDFPAEALRALESALAGCRSVLDVGAGVGALAVPLAGLVERVTALEPSPAMLDELRANLSRHRLANVTCIAARWGEAEVGPHDLILVANVAPIFQALLPFVAAAERLTPRAIALVRNVGPGAEKFYFGELYPLLLGRPYPPREDYLRTLTLLHGRGIHANVRIIAYRFDQPFDDFQEAVDFWAHEMRLAEPEQIRRLQGFLESRLQRAGPRLLAPMRRQSAVIWWRVAPEGPESERRLPSSDSSTCPRNFFGPSAVCQGRQ